MSLQQTSTGTTTRRWPATGAGSEPGRGLVLAVTLLAGVFMVAAGAWALLAPSSFADAAGFPRHTHFVHDAGAFQLGIGITLLLAITWRDGPALALAGLLAASTVHAVNHTVDLDPGGHGWDPWGLATLTLVTAIALIVRLRQLGWVIGEVGIAASPSLVPFVRQKTVLLTSYRRDSRPVGTPVSIAVDGDRAVVRSFEKAWKTRRIHRNPTIEVAPSTARGRPTGPAIRAHARRLEGAEASHAAGLLAAKHPLLHGLLVPLTHRLGRAKTGKTVHFELTPLDGDLMSPPRHRTEPYQHLDERLRRWLGEQRRFLLPTTAHTSRPWRIHEIAGDFHVEDVWAIPTPGGPDDLERLVRQLAGGAPGEGAHVSTLVSRMLFAVRWKLGKLLGWDRADAGIGARVRTLRDRLPADLREGPRGPDLRAVPFTSVYLTHDEWTAEMANRTVHTVMHIGWVPDGADGYRGQMAVLVKPNGLLGALYMAGIKPFRYLGVYPALLRAIGREWQRLSGGGR